ncbi:MAG TPA: DUF5107 domain-containing protein [Puia sp.]|nr:DUF5107 domain-containing protein [Puia sp.]
MNRFIKLLLAGLLSAGASSSFAQNEQPAAGKTVPVEHPSTIREYQQSFPTYPFSDPSPIPLLTQVYPYFRYDGFTDKAVDKSWKVVELQNDYIRLLILPEIGGKIWAAIERSSGRPYLYYNHAVKFRDVAMRGPWTSGGLEANYGIIGHTPNCATPVDYVTRVNEDGSVSCTIGTLDLLSRSYWRMEIRLPKDQALFSTRSFWYNTTALEQPYYHWMNAGLKAGDDLEFVYPGNRYLGHEGEYSDWPVNKSNGKEISWYKSNNFGGYKSYHVFGKYTEFSGAYWHKDDLGMVRWGAHDDKAGKKIWIWGLSRQGMIWEKLLTDTDGQYVELQSGRLFNQNAEGSSRTPFKHRSFAPYGTETWQENWYPVLGTRGFVAANQYGALNILQENGWLKVFFSPVQHFSDTLSITVSGKALYKKYCSFAPLRLFVDSVRFAGAGADSVAGAGAPTDLVVTIGDHLLRYDASPLAGNLSRPVEAPADFDWGSAYGNYLKGCEALDQKNMPQAETAFGLALLKDPNYGPALVKMAELLYRNMRYKEALEYAIHALRIHTEDGGANFIYGLVNEQLQNHTDAKDGFDIASLDPSYRSAAYTRLAKLYLKEKDLPRARSYAEKALVNNRDNIEALQLLAVCMREAAQEILARIDHEDPLNHFSRWEKYRTDPTAFNKERFVSLIRNELPQETFLELGIWYYNCGLPEDALRVFRLSPACAEINLWIAWLSHQPIDWTKIDPVRAFPFRSETAQLLEDLLKTDEHWFFKYQLALIYKDRNRIAECKSLLLSCGDQPDFAPFYAMRAAVFSIPAAQAAPGRQEAGGAQPTAARQDSLRPMHDLQRALQLDPQWRYQKLLAEYEIAHSNPVRAEEIAGGFYRSHPESYIMGMLYAKTLLLNQKYPEGDRLLSHLAIIPFEGATAGRELYREAKLMQAVQSMKQRQYKEALTWIGQAKKWPENLGVGEPYAENEDLRLEDWMSYRCYTALNQNEAATASLQRILRFQPAIDNTVLNFIPANTVITNWAYEKLGEAPPPLVGTQPPLPGAGNKEEPGANERILKALSSL